MKKIVFFVFLMGVLCFAGCNTPKESVGTVGPSVSSINQPRALPKKYTTITTVTETKPDGSVVTTRTTSVVVPLEDGTTKEALVGPDVIAMHKDGAQPGTIVTINPAADPMNPQVNPAQNPNNTVTNNPTATTTLTNTSAEPDYMSTRERDMIKEINLVRTNPRGYIQHIENYKQDIQKVKYTDIDYLERELIASDELIKELRTMQPASALKDHRGLYNVAMGHGITIQKRGYSSHLGNDGLYPWDRISNSVPELVDGNENLVGGPESVRDAVILLLVDSGIQGRGHRKTLLQKDWEYVACYEVGVVGGIKNYWVQNFAKGGNVPVSTTTPATSSIDNPADNYPNLTTSINQGATQPTSNPRPMVTTTQPASTNTSPWGGTQPGATTTTTTQPPSTTSTWNSSNPIATTSPNNPRPTTTTTTTNPRPTTTAPSNPNIATRPRPSTTTTRPPNTTTTRPNPNVTNTNPNPTPPPRSNPTIEATATSANPNVPVEERKFDTGRSVSYMTAREKDMVLEINRARGNPQRYVRYIDEYRAKVKRNNNPNSPETKEELAAIDELRQTLNTMAPLPVLKPSDAVHRAAKKHGDEMKANGKVSHIGSDGSYPWDRILREDPAFKDGNENLVGGPADVREAVILLLVDAGISGRGHRKTLLNKDWIYISCHEVGTVGRMPHTWVQNFAR